MVRIYKDLKEKELLGDVRLLLQVHDELVFEIKENEVETMAKEIRHTMESVVEEVDLQGVPLVVDVSIGKNWGEMKKM